MKDDFRYTRICCGCPQRIVYKYIMTGITGATGATEQVIYGKRRRSLGKGYIRLGKRKWAKGIMPRNNRQNAE